MTFMNALATDDEDSENTTSRISIALVEQASTYATDWEEAQVNAFKSPDKVSMNSVPVPPTLIDILADDDGQ